MLFVRNIIRLNYVPLLGQKASSFYAPFFCRTEKSRTLTTGKHFSARDTSTGNTTVNEKELQQFKTFAKLWWDYDLLRPLHELQNVRMPLITDGIIRICSPQQGNAKKPLQGITVLDVGCGGGIVAEPLARLGAHVTGIDPVAESIEVARNHAEADPEIRNNLKYICGTVEDLCKENKKYDAVVCSEVLDHVDNVPHFVKYCIHLARHGGYLHFSTINRTIFSYFYLILLGEYILRFVPRGSHDWRKFLKPREVKILLETHNCTVLRTHTTFYDPIFKRCYDIPYAGGFYSFCAVKGSVITDNIHVR